LTGWYQRYCSGKPLTDSTAKRGMVSNALEEAYASLEEAEAEEDELDNY
jgi:hypothetical protein